MALQASEGLLSPFLRKQRQAVAFPYLVGTVLDFGCGAGEFCRYCAPNSYLGVERDEESLEASRKRNPEWMFQAELPKEDRKFDTIVALAVIEHMTNPKAFLKELTNFLTPGGRIIITTPHPIGEAIHTVGAKIGLFSIHGSEEHETLLDRALLVHLAKEVGLALYVYKRFLFGFNQLCVFTS